MQTVRSVSATAACHFAAFSASSVGSMLPSRNCRQVRSEKVLSKSYIRESVRSSWRMSGREWRRRSPGNSRGRLPLGAIDAGFQGLTQGQFHPEVHVVGLTQHGDVSTGLGDPHHLRQHQVGVDPLGYGTGKRPHRSWVCRTAKPRSCARGNSLRRPCPRAGQSRRQSLFGRRGTPAASPPAGRDKRGKTRLALRSQWPLCPR